MKTILPKIIYLSCLMLLGILVGCGHSDRASVQGTVALDGQPIAEGTISFVYADQSSKSRADQAAWAKVKDGRYEIPAAAGPSLGRNRVEIHASGKTGRKSPLLPDRDEYAETTPARYHVQSELFVDVKSGGNTCNFQLEKDNRQP